MGTYNSTYKSAYSLLRGLRGVISAVIIGVISAHEPPSRVSGLGLITRKLLLTEQVGLVRWVMGRKQVFHGLADGGGGECSGLVIIRMGVAGPPPPQTQTKERQEERTNGREKEKRKKEGTNDTKNKRHE